MGRPSQLLKPRNDVKRLNLGVTPLAWFDAGYGVCTGGARRCCDGAYFTGGNIVLGTSDLLSLVWTYRHATGQQVLWEIYEDADNYTRFEITSSDKLHFIAKVGGTTKIEVTGSTSLSATSTWYFCGVAVDRDNAENCKVYLDGANDTSGSPTTSTDSITNSGTLHIGASGTGHEGIYCDAAIANLMISKPADVASVQSAAISGLYNTAQGKTYGDLTSSEISQWGITAYWNCNENSSTADLIDQHGTNDGAPSGEIAAVTGPAAAIATDDIGGHHGVLANFSDAQLLTGWRSDVPSQIGSGYSLRFDGTNNHCDVGNTSLGLSTALTFAAWVQLLDDGQNAILTRWHYPADGCWWFGVEALTRLIAMCIGTGYSRRSADSVVLDTWTHIAATWVGGAAPNIYINGVLSNGASSGSPPSALPTSSEDVRIGCERLSGNLANFANMLCADLRVYNRALTAAEVAQLASGTDLTSGLMARWKFDDGPQTMDPVDGDWIIGWESRGEDRTQTFQDAAAKRPIWCAEALNGKPGIYFDGTNDGLIGAAPFAGDAGLILAVIKPDAQTAADRTVFAQADEASANRFLLLEIPANTMVLGLTQKNDDTPDEVRGSLPLTADGHVVLAKSDGARYDFCVDFVEDTESVVSGSNSGDWFDDVDYEDNFTIGMLKTSSEGNAFKGYICELIVLPDGTTRRDIKILERYLGAKYAL